jgi:RsiW-degrading membrane proteinase PrsW (M82 family)
MLSETIRNSNGDWEMEQGTIPPPPPPEPQQENGFRLREVHLPGTAFFKSFRRQIAAYEVPPCFREGFEPLLAAVGAFILSALFTLFVSLGQVSVFVPVFSGAYRWIGSVFLAPPVEETIKGLSVVAVALVLPRAIPNRRYAVAIGVAAGLGYSLSEDITYFANPDIQPQSMIIRLLTNPIGHPVFTAICAIGVFVFIARLRSGLGIFRAISGIPLLLWLLAVLNHAFWNAWQFAVVPFLGYAGIALSILVIVLPFLIILRDFLGGHFNFGHFFETIPEPTISPPNSIDEKYPMPMELHTRQGRVQNNKPKGCININNTKQEESENAWTLR